MPRVWQRLGWAESKIRSIQADPIEENIYKMDFRRITGAGIDTAEWGMYRIQVHQWEPDRYLRLL